MMQRSGLFPRFVQAARTVGEGLLLIAYPPSCPGCGARMAGTRAPLCNRCLHRLDRPTPADVAERLGRRPQAAAPLDDVFALWLFDKGGVLQRVQHGIKYGNRPHYGVVCGAWMGRALGAPEPGRAALVVPVPLHRRRLLERGYNQSEMLARGLVAARGGALRSDLLARVRPTRSQTGLPHDARWPNVSGAFAAPRPAAVAGRRVLLVDDVLTTGATAGAAAAVLRAAGASSIGLAVLALAR